MNKILFNGFCIFCFLTSCIQQKIDRQTSDIAQTWEVTRKDINGVNDIGNFEAIYTDYKIYFSEKGSYNESYTTSGLSVSINGTWIFENNGNEIKLIDSTRTRIYDILELNGAKLTLQLLGISDEEVYFMETIY